MESGRAEIQSARAKELFLDTKGACFLCLKEVQIASENNNNGFTNETTGTTEVCLRNICRYLNINPSFILLKSLKGDITISEEEKEKTESQKNKCDFSVSLCSTCATVSNKLSELVCQLEMIKMIIKNQVTQFYQSIITSEQLERESEHCRWKKLQELLSSGSNSSPVESRLVENLRQETKTKCETKLKHLKIISQPKVRLQKLTTPKESLSLPTSKSLPEMRTSSNSEYIQENDDLFSAPEPDSPDQISNESSDYPSSNDNAKQMVLDICKKYTNSYLADTDNTRLQCLLCNFTLARETSSFEQHSLIRVHIVNSHTGLFFDLDNQQNLSQASRSNHCKSVLFRETKQARLHCKLSDPYLCNICNLTSGNASEFRYHLIFEHYNIIKEKLKSFKIEEESKKDLPQKNQWICGCRREFTLKEKWDNHQKSCSFSWKRKVEPIAPLEIQAPAGPNPTVQQSKQIWICNVTRDGCGRTFPWKSDLLKHQQVCCPDMNQSNEESDKKPSFSKKTNKLVTKILRKNCEKVEVKGKANLYRCLACKKMSKPYHKLIMIKNLVNAHPEVFFPKDLDHGLSKIGVRNYCKRILSNDLFYKQVIIESKECILCAFCNAKVRDKYLNLKYHLMMNHYDVLKKKIICGFQGQTTSGVAINTVNIDLQVELLSEATFCTDPLQDDIMPSGDHDDNPDESGQISNSKVTLEMNDQSSSGLSEAPFCNDPLQNTISSGDHDDNPDESVPICNSNVTLTLETDDQSSSGHQQFIEGNTCSFEKYDTDFMKKHLAQSQDGRKCLYCSFSNRRDVSKIYLHLMNNHLEKIFNPVKFDQLSDKEFLNCCKETVLQEMKNGQAEGVRRELKFSLKNGKQKHGLFCLLCDKSYNYLGDFRYHFVFKHYKILENKLMQRQNLIVGEKKKEIGTHFMMMMGEEDGQVEVKMENLEEDSNGNSESVCNLIGDGDDAMEWENDAVTTKVECDPLSNDDFQFTTISRAGEIKMGRILPDL